MNTKIIEIMPDNLPDWVYQDIKDGQLLSRLVERLEDKEKLITDQVLEILRLRAELDNLNESIKGEG